MPGGVGQGHAHDGMVLLPAGRFRMGSARHYPEEAPVRDVSVDRFLIDVHPVTVQQFAAFVQDTGYVTVAERPLDPEQYPGVPVEQLQPGALVFRSPERPVPGKRPEPWWVYTPGAHWRRPGAGESALDGRLDHPVTCVAFADAEAYARWAGKGLPDEAQWEWAARGGLEGAEFAWGDELAPGGRRMANTWQGDRFPYDRDGRGRIRTTPVGSFPANGYGLHDMIGNVWEWTRAWYRAGQSARSEPACCGGPPADSYDLALPGVRIPRRVVKGGSFLCSPDYCARYRPAARQPQMEDTASVHLGFRCVMNLSAERG